MLGRVMTRAALLLGIGIGAFVLACAVGASAAYLVSLSYDDRAGDDRPAVSVKAPARDGAPAAPETVASGASESAFVHRATARNIVNNSTYVNNRLTNGDPNAFILVAQVGESGSDVGAHPIGVWYDRYRGGKWAIFNQDLAPMSEGTAFEVVILEGAGRAAFVHRATAANTAENNTYFDHPLTSGNPSAVLSVTPNWNPGGGAGVYDNHPVGVRYDGEREKWAIFNEDRAAMPEGAAFNVAVSQSTESRER